MKIYTKTGDGGDTGLIGGARVKKDALRVEAYGTVDELNAALGVVVAALHRGTTRDSVVRLQNDLHLVCADLASPQLEAEGPRVQPQHVARLEALIDALDQQLPPLTQFILPGGVVAGAQLHLARTVARRAERRVIALAEREALNPTLVPYLNRLSDALFVMARFVNQLADLSEKHPDYV